MAFMVYITKLVWSFFVLLASASAVMYNVRILQLFELNAVTAVLAAGTFCVVVLIVCCENWRFSLAWGFVVVGLISFLSFTFSIAIFNEFISENTRTASVFAVCASIATFSIGVQMLINLFSRKQVRQTPNRIKPVLRMPKYQQPVRHR